ncbi:hypothetical protein GQ600_6587 [Phytophthora cactorum]|nr:hypothetical protein GQ600_6587 [Phytophthora cactorum]
MLKFLLVSSTLRHTFQPKVQELKDDSLSRRSSGLSRLSVQLRSENSSTQHGGRFSSQTHAPVCSMHEEEDLNEEHEEQRHFPLSRRCQCLLCAEVRGQGAKTTKMRDECDRELSRGVSFQRMRHSNPCWCCQVKDRRHSKLDQWELNKRQRIWHE